MRDRAEKIERGEARAGSDRHAFGTWAGLLVLVGLLVAFPSRADAQTGSIAGTVTVAGTGAGLGSAGVNVFTMNGTLAASTTTASGTGAYTIASLAPGRYFAVASTSGTLGYVTQAYNSIPCAPCTITNSTPIVVTGGATTANVNFAMSSGATITGTITDADTGLPISGVPVTAFTGPGANVKTTNSNASGVYTIGGLPAATYFVRTSIAGAPNYINEAYNNVPCTPCDVTQTTPVLLASGGIASNINFALQPGGTISGTVTEAGSGSLLASVPVAVFAPTGVSVKTSSTSGAGTYSIGGLPAGTYFVRTNPSSTNHIPEAYNDVPCLPCDVTTTTGVSVTVGATTANINFALSGGGTITGTVTDAGTGAVLPGTVVQVGNAAGAFLFSAATNNAGAYSLPGLPTGSYFVKTLVPPGVNYVDEAHNNVACAPCDIVTTTAIAVTAGGTTANINFALAPGGTITGAITELGSGAPLGGRTVVLVNASGQFAKNSVTSDAAGAYQITGLPPGTFFARTAFTATHGVELYDNVPCPNNACTLTTQSTPIVVGAGATVSNVNFSVTPTGPLDLAVDFGSPYGAWLLSPAGAWQPLHPFSPLAIVKGDLDGNGAGDLVVNFGPGIGVFAWMNHTSWTFIHPFSPSHVVTGDLDNDGRDEGVFVFPGFGVWRWSAGTWNLVHPLDPGRLAVGHVDTTPGDDLITDFPTFGIFVFANNTTWTHLHPLNSTAIVTGDLDGNGQEELIIDFPGFGLFVYLNNTSWSFLHPLQAARLAVGRVDFNRQADLVIDFGATYGIWVWRNNATWTPLHPFTSENITLGDRDATGRDEVVIDFGSSYGLWQYANDNMWQGLHPLSPEGIEAARLH